MSFSSLEQKRVSSHGCGFLRAPLASLSLFLSSSAVTNAKTRETERQKNKKNNGLEASPRRSRRRKQREGKESPQVFRQRGQRRRRALLRCRLGAEVCLRCGSAGRPGAFFFSRVSKGGKKKKQEETNELCEEKTSSLCWRLCFERALLGRFAQVFSLFHCLGWRLLGFLRSVVLAACASEARKTWKASVFFHAFLRTEEKV